MSGKATATGKVAFVFPGQGPQWVGMGLKLLGSSPVFARGFRKAADAVEQFVDWSVDDALRGGEGAPSLDRVDVVQPALFVVSVALAGLWRSFGVEPTAVVGHSQGEVAAACVAGALSLEDAARVVALRGQALTAIAGDGGLVSLKLSVEEVPARVEPWGERLSVGAVNGPRSVVVSGDVGALDELLAACEADGTWARRIPIDYASHSAQVEEIEDRLLADLAGIEPRSGEVAFVSTVTGETLDTAELDAGYWYRNLRQPVRFQDATETLLADGYATLVEVSPHPVMAVALQDTVEAAAADPAAIQVLGTLRRDDGDLDRCVASLAQAHVDGARVDWRAFFAAVPGRCAGLPTYPFQRERYWLQLRAATGEAAPGQSLAHHPLLGAAIAVAGSDRWLFTTRLSASTPRWLGEHAAHGRTVVPSSLFVELALHAGAEVGCPHVEELAVETPLVLPAQGAVQVQILIGEDESGRRQVSVHARPEDLDDPRLEWVRHAGGTLAPAADGETWTPSEWPPEGAEPIEPDAIYDALAAGGLEHGPAFQGVRDAWRLEGETFAEIGVAGADVEGAAEGFGIHPALLDAALQPAIAGLLDDGDAMGVALPAVWRGVGLASGGSSLLRVRLRPSGDGELAVALADATGNPVGSIDSVSLRPLAAERLGLADAGVRNSLFRLGWTPVAPSAPAHADGDWAAIGDVGGSLDGVLSYADIEALLAALADGAAVPRVVLAELPQGQPETAAGVHDATRATLAMLQALLGDERLQFSQLLLVSKRSVVSGPADADDVSLPAAAAAGLVRSAQSESPGRIVLVDVDGDDASRAALPQALAAGEPQLALREGAPLAPRMLRVEAEEAGEPVSYGDGTVLVTGGTGMLGGLVARHLVEAHGVRRLLLLSRSGPAAEGAGALEAELVELGAEVDIVAGDAADRDGLEALLADLPADRPLTGVVHSAGAIDDAAIAALDGGRLDAVMRPKVDGALNLHELTVDLDLSAFVLFSSASATFGGPGQGNYAAANALLDALAQSRRSRGLAATSLAWGLWEGDSAMTGHLREADRARPARFGMVELTAVHGLELLDAAGAANQPHALLVPIDLGRLRLLARTGMVLPPMRQLVRVQARPLASDGALGRRLAGLDREARERELLDFVRGQVAEVLGRSGAEAVEIDSKLLELGFDSLTAVELISRLNAATGTRLAPSAAFDHPTPADLAAHLAGRIGGVEPGPESAGETSGLLGTMLREAGDGNRVGEFISLLMDVSRFRPAFEWGRDPNPAGAVRLADGPAPEPLVCFPTVVAMSGPHQFARFAKPFRGVRDVAALAFPGFLAGEPVPASADDAVEAALAAVTSASGDAAPVLVGYSSGGILALEVARRLEQMDRPLAAVVLLDPVAAGTRAEGDFQPQLVDRMVNGGDGTAAGLDGNGGADQPAAADRHDTYAGADDTRLTAMGAYLRMFSGWQVPPLVAPVLVAWASERVGPPEDGPLALRSQLEHTAVETVGDHFTLIEQHAETTARTVEEWLSNRNFAGEDEPCDRKGVM